MENRNVANIEAQVYPLKEPRNNTLAMASLTIGGCFAVRGVKVVQGRALQTPIYDSFFSALSRKPLRSTLPLGVRGMAVSLSQNAGIM